jgi:6-phosphogluconate dehydrogenase
MTQFMIFLSIKNSETKLFIDCFVRKWNNGKLKSFLIEKTVKIFQTKDTLHGGCLLDKVSDVAGSKGTGAWTVQVVLKKSVVVGVCVIVFHYNRRQLHDKFHAQL